MVWSNVLGNVSGPIPSLPLIGIGVVGLGGSLIGIGVGGRVGW